MNQAAKNYYNQKSDYGINSLRRKKINSLVAADIKQGQKKILDLGCASGYISGDWRENNHIIGADIGQESIAQAKNILTRAYLLDLESDNWPAEITNQKYDIILAAEILEHLFDPKEFLSKLKELLKPKGYIIVTTPNFLAWNNRLRMFFGQWSNKEIFNDPGHIHLFSYNSLKKLLAQLNLKIIAQNNLWHPDCLEKFSKLLPPNLFVYQTIFKIKK